MRISLRVRLTVVFGLLFFAAGTAVLLVSLILVQNSMDYSLHLAFGWTRDGEATIGGITSSMQRNLLGKGGLAVLGVGIVATTAGWAVAGRILRRLHQITAIARGIAGRTLHRRIALDGPPDEVKTLADSFDRMLDRLDDAFAGQSRFITNAAHELKTPLALNRTLVEVAMMRRDSPPEVQQLGENLLAVNARHERLIDSLLTLARAGEAVTERRAVDLAAVATDVAGRVAGEAATAGVAVHLALDRAVTVGDPLLLEQVVRNLVDNAVRYNVRDGWVEVRTLSRGPVAEVVVSNTGVAISTAEIPVLFEPFRRLLDRVGSAGGSGLGLSIVRAVARAHRGDAEATPRAGGGLVVRVSLPLAPDRDRSPVDSPEWTIQSGPGRRPPRSGRLAAGRRGWPGRLKRP
jgi:signal transduction histidine kinase